MYIHIMHKNNLNSIKKKGLVSRDKLGTSGGNYDRDKVSAFYFMEDVNNQILEEALNVVFKGKNSNPYNNKHIKNDYIIFKIKDPEINWEYQEKPREMYSPYTTLSDSFYEKFRGFAKTTEDIKWETLERIKI
ncbi:hypothetical protein SAMN02745249_01323 [Atopostipes suicloacalis DSM 15692]|uniref:Uncharacterized protein n=1 Tax=Atopostipes suicloacalis DSM 15692 TaxID=1121025 RepID=A0A1M4X0F7_9LACT|nr:hypothetical protein [Atopostipes suicloacalis]SHE86988.1 hypothetical protein SAMN02745249_01323 [Atopostipes suicloacalis DSM 15692]